MRYLIEAARELGLDEIVDRALENNNVHGVALTLHDRWLDFMYADQVVENYPGVVALDLSERPSGWVSAFGHRSPIIVTVHLKPGTFLNLQDLLGGNSFLFVRQENRVIPQMIANPQTPFTTMQGGISISNSGSNITGTLGGIVKDTGTGSMYAVSCGHIISNGVTVVQPAQKDHGVNSVIGQCIYSKNAQANQGNICNPRNPNAVLNDMDVALIELSQVNSQFAINNIGPVDDFLPAHLINKGIAIEFTGRTSSHRTNLVVNSIGVVQQVIDLNGAICCYKDLIQIQDPSLSSLVQNSPAQSGDSGAWAITRHNGRNEWCAMIVAEDRQSAYGIMSEDIITHLNTKKNLNLVCN
jgi:hypothetical protein